MTPNYVQIDIVIVSINTGNHTISLNKHTIGLETYNSTCQYTFRPMWGVLLKVGKEICSGCQVKERPKTMTNIILRWM